MTWRWVLPQVVVGGAIIVGATLHADGAVGQGIQVVHSGSPTYAIPLKDGNAAVVWWDAVSDPAHPGWRCEVPASREGGAGRTIIPLTAAAGDWRAALAEARVLLQGRAADGE
jgi:hypothetical protein